MEYLFKMAPLPKAVYELLRQIAVAEGMTQRAVIAAGVLGLARLKLLDPAQVADVLAEAKSLCPRRDSNAA